MIPVGPAVPDMSGEAGPTRRMAESLQYVVLRHEGVDEPHFDLMFEIHPGSDLATWRVDDWPINDNSTFTPLRPHRRAYLQYEGAISADRGQVHRVHVGQHEVEEDSPQLLIVRLENGQRIMLPRKPTS